MSKLSQLYIFKDFCTFSIQETLQKSFFFPGEFELL